MYVYIMGLYLPPPQRKGEKPLSLDLENIKYILATTSRCNNPSQIPQEVGRGKRPEGGGGGFKHFARAAAVPFAATLSTSGTFPLPFHNRQQGGNPGVFPL